MSRKAIFYVAFFAFLVVGFYVVLSKVIPGFGKKRIAPISLVKSFSFTDQNGNQFTQAQTVGKVYAVEYFFTTCTGICPKMNNNMKKVYEKFRNEPSFMILSHTSDPGTDSSQRLKRYADSIGAQGNWVFLTGRKDSLYQMARHSYKLDDPQNHFTNIEDDFLHTQYFAVVNKKGEVRKIYDGLKESEIKSMITDIEELLKE